MAKRIIIAISHRTMSNLSAVFQVKTRLSGRGKSREAPKLTTNSRAERPVPPLAQPIEASFAKPDLNAPTSVSISASVIGVENVHAPVLMMLQPSL